MSLKTPKLPQGKPSSSPQPSPAETLVLATEVNPEDQVAENHDESIEDYMSQLLARVNGGAPREGGYSMPKQRPEAEKKPAEKAPEPAKVEPEPEPEPVELRQPARAPERRDHLSNMREVANMSARSAIGTHSCKTLINQMYRDLFIAIAAGVLACVLAASSPGFTSPTYLGAIITILMAVLFGWRYFRSAKMLARQPLPSGEAPTAPDAQPNS